MNLSKLREMVDDKRASSAGVTKFTGPQRVGYALAIVKQQQSMLGIVIGPGDMIVNKTVFLSFGGLSSNGGSK